MGASISEVSPHLSALHAPDALASLQAWVVWRYEHIAGEKKPRKIPYYTSGIRRFGVQGSSKDIAQLSSFDAAKQVAIRKGFDGVGFAALPGSGITALDFDDCVSPAGVDPTIESLVAGTYAEYSPSGNGIRAFVRAELGNLKSHGTHEHPIGFETFESKGFVTFTGNILEITELTGSENTLALPSDSLLAYHRQRFSARKQDGYDAESEPIIGLTEEQLRVCLDALDPSTGHDDWLHIGMALHHETQGDGFELWNEWSANSDKYPGQEALESRWLSFGQSGGRPITARALVRQAQLNGAPIQIDVASPNEFEVLPEEEKPSGHFGLFSQGEFAAQESHLKWLVKGILPKAQIGVLFGDSGSGKSFLAYDLCAALARGVQWNGYRVTQSRILYIVAEGVSGFRQRIKAYCHQHALSPTDFDIVVCSGIAPNLMDPASVARLLADVKQFGPFDLIVIDTFAQVTPGANENAGEDMGKALANCKRLNQRSGAMVLLIHHSGKDASKGARGWSGLRAAADVELEVTRIENDRCLEVTKMKDGQDGIQLGFKLLTVTLGTDEDGDDITSCIVEYGSALPRAKGREKKKIGELEALIMHTLQDLKGLSSEPVGHADLIQAVIPQLLHDPAKRDLRGHRVMRSIEQLASAQILQIEGENIRLVEEETL